MSSTKMQKVLGTCLAYAALVCGAAQGQTVTQNTASSAVTVSAPALESAAPSVAASSGPKTPESLAGSDLNAERYQNLRENADRLRAVYDQADKDGQAEIDGLMRTKRCYSPRVNADLDRMIKALNDWSEAELKYWTLNAEDEAKGVEGQEKGLVQLEADKKHRQDVMDSDVKDREDLLRGKANLEKFGKRTDEIRRQIDSLVKDIKDIDDRIAADQKDIDDIEGKIRGIGASRDARLVDMRQNKQRVEAYVLQVKSYYEEQRAAEQEVCNLQQPARKTPLPQPRKSN